MICEKCGTPNEAGTGFCVRCGASLTQPAGGYYTTPAPAPAKEPGKGFAIASMILGILSVACLGGLIQGILALIFGGVAKSKGSTSGMATTGIVLGAIGLAIWLITMIACDSMALMEYALDF